MATKLSPKEKAARQDAREARKAELAAMTPEQRKVEREREARTRFLKLAEPRTNRAIKALDSVAKMAGPGYDHSEVETEAIATALIQAVNVAVRALRGEKVGKQHFSLPVE